MILPTRRFLVLATTATILLFFFFGLHFNFDYTLPRSTTSLSTPTSSILSNEESSHKLHLLIPATAANRNLCRLLLSATIAGYPEPILIGWEGKGVYNGTKSHLFKITETLAYLESLPPSADKDLVLLVDGYDVWLQLRPEVMISRYAQVIAANDQRLHSDGILSSRTDDGTEVRNTIVFNPDKVHWPQNANQAAVWAAPESFLGKKAFGAKTDTDIHTVRPKFLNSGAIIGPVKDMRDMFAATLEMLHAVYNSKYANANSDQYYFAEVWGEQEVGRKKLQLDGEEFVDEKKEKNKQLIVPKVEGKRTEYYMCLDYGSDIFQAATGWERSLAWMRFKDGTVLPKEGKEAWSAASMKSWKLPADIAASEAPFAAMGDERGWEEVMLGTNTVSKSPFPLFHVTGNKKVRDWWWPKMWFHPHAEELLKASSSHSIPVTVDGAPWTAAIPVNPQERVDTGGKGGAWDAEGPWIPWDNMCKAYEPILYLEEEPPEEGNEAPKLQW